MSWIPHIRPVVRQPSETDLTVLSPPPVCSLSRPLPVTTPALWPVTPWSRLSSSWVCRSTWPHCRENTWTWTHWWDTHTLTHTHTHSLTHTHTHSHTNTHSFSHSVTHAYIHSLTHTHSHSPTHTHTGPVFCVLTLDPCADP